jgi:hypothetical protein
MKFIQGDLEELGDLMGGNPSKVSKQKAAGALAAMGFTSLDQVKSLDDAELDALLDGMEE